ncbi:MAG: porin [Rhodospirillaceae bacterium]
MNKKLLAVAVVGALASPAAFAQNVTIYGGIDVGYQNASNYASGASNHNFITSGGDYTSRIGFKGSDDIMAGTTAVFVMEAGISADTGGTDSAGFWQRQVYGGLDSKQWGALTIGRQYTHMFNQAGLGGWSTLTLAGWLNPEGFGGSTATQLVRASNYVKYSSPNFSGFTAGLGYSPSARTAAEVTTPTATRGTSDGRYWDGQISWRSGPFGVAFAHNNEKFDDTVDTTELKRNQLTGKWDNGVFGVFGGYAKDQATGDENIKRYWIQPVFRFGGNNEVFGIWGKNKFQGGGTDEKATWWGIAARHYMTKRTWLYAGYGTTKNDDGVNGTPTTFAASAAAGQDPRGIQVGVATTF